jgi:cardiolipin synthase
MTVDGCWSAIGSSNFDDRSFEINDEITLGFHDSALALELDTIFERDTGDCAELTSEAWSRRSLGHRLLDGTLYLINEQL